MPQDGLRPEGRPQAPLRQSQRRADPVRHLAVSPQEGPERDRLPADAVRRRPPANLPRRAVALPSSQSRQVARPSLLPRRSGRRRVVLPPVDLEKEGGSAVLPVSVETREGGSVIFPARKPTKERGRAILPVVDEIGETGRTTLPPSQTTSQTGRAVLPPSFMTWESRNAVFLGRRASWEGGSIDAPGFDLRRGKEGGLALTLLGACGLKLDPFRSNSLSSPAGAQT